MNLPLFGAEASGLFANNGLDVELVPPARRRAGPGGQGGGDEAPEPARPDFEVTAVQSNLSARARRPELAGGQPLAMTDRQWEATIAHATRTYGLTPMTVGQVARSELVGTAPSVGLVIEAPESLR